MTQRPRADERNLTGVWNGLYTYEDGRSTSFVATLIDARGALSGTTHESATHESAIRGAVLYATLAGMRSASTVAFTKTYDRPDVFHDSPIRYDGTLSADGTEIEGRWTIVKAWSGKFLMIRAAGTEAQASKSVFARV